MFKGFYGWIKGDQIHFTRQTSTKGETVVDTVQNTASIAIFDASLQQDRRSNIIIADKSFIVILRVIYINFTYNYLHSLFNDNCSDKTAQT